MSMKSPLGLLVNVSHEFTRADDITTAKQNSAQENRVHILFNTILKNHAATKSDRPVE